MLYRIAQRKDAFVADVLGGQNGSIHWDIHFTCSILDWELESLQSFFALLYSTNVDRNRVDKMVWKPAKTGCFEVNSYYRALTTGGSHVFPWKSNLRVKVPSRVAFLYLARGKILTLDNLRRNIYIFNKCCMCKSSWELVAHLLLHCSYAHNWRMFVFSLFGVS